MFMNLQFTSCMLIKGPFILSKKLLFHSLSHSRNLSMVLGITMMPVHCVKVDQCKVICHFFTP